MIRFGIIGTGWRSGLWPMMILILRSGIVYYTFPNLLQEAVSEKGKDKDEYFDDGSRG
jgi:hypothetical protein